MADGQAPKVCSAFWDEAWCSLKPCKGCGFSFQEIERRKKLPLDKLDNGLYAKIVGKRKKPED